MSAIGRVVVAGVAGSGKSTLGVALAHRHGAAFLDADAFHAEVSIEKIRAGRPLNDEDRRPWLERLSRQLAARDAVVLACSALGRAHRDVLRRAGGVHFVLLEISRAEAVRRLSSRRGHFMGPDLIDSQFAALELPGPDEPDVSVIDGELPLASLVVVADAALGLSGNSDTAGGT